MADEDVNLLGAHQFPRRFLPKTLQHMREERNRCDFDNLRGTELEVQ
jgi:hypothetical protein